jgi:hypothetical protein
MRGKFELDASILKSFGDLRRYFNGHVDRSPHPQLTLQKLDKNRKVGME